MMPWKQTDPIRYLRDRTVRRPCCGLRSAWPPDRFKASRWFGHKEGCRHGRS